MDLLLPHTPCHLTHTHAQTQTHTYRHTRAHTHAHTRAHTHTHTVLDVETTVMKRATAVAGSPDTKKQILNSPFDPPATITASLRRQRRGNHKHMILTFFKFDAGYIFNLVSGRDRGGHTILGVLASISCSLPHNTGA